jgi:hypothetical protein
MNELDDDRRRSVWPWIAAAALTIIAVGLIALWLAQHG